MAVRARVQIYEEREEHAHTLIIRVLPALANKLTRKSAFFLSYFSRSILTKRSFSTSSSVRVLTTATVGALDAPRFCLLIFSALSRERGSWAAICLSGRRGGMGAAEEEPAWPELDPTLSCPEDDVADEDDGDFFLREAERSTSIL